MKIIYSIFSILIITAQLGLRHTITARPTAPVKQITHHMHRDTRLTTLHALFTALGVNVDPTYEAMNAYAQAYWLRKPGQERWHMTTSRHQPQANQMTTSLKQLGMIDRVDPSIQTSDYAMLLGATVYSMRTRMQHMLGLIDAGTFMPKQIVVLTGDRPLDPIQESESILLDKTFIRNDWHCPESLPTNESEAAKFVWDQLQKSDHVKHIPIVFVATPMLEKNGKIVRPTTEDSLKTWLNLSPNPGSIIAFSSNPYVPYQHNALRLFLIKAGWFKHKGTLETVGLAFTPKEDKKQVANLLDNVARYIYSILQIEKALATD